MGRKALDVANYIDKLEQALLIGATYELAAMYAGISRKTFERWRAQMADAPDGSPLGQLRDRLREVEGRAAVTWLARIEQAAKDGNWAAAAWKLERRWPEMYARPGLQKHAFTDPSGEQPWEPTIGLAVLLEAARNGLPSPHVPALPPPSDESC